MDRCEICGRHPAKHMTFRAHQGFVLLRREIKYSGVFCRDCAIAVYAKARGVTLAGMWFSPGSLVMGTLGSLWDSAKLLDLPPEVKDEPWVPHKVACPNCRHGQFLSAGVADCEKCRSQFVIVSCERCGTVHIQAATALLEEITVRCRECGLVSNAPAPARNAPLLLFPRAVAEIASKVGATPVEFGQWSAAIGEHHRLQPASWTWLYDYYSECCQQSKVGQVLQNCIRFQQFQFLAFVLVVCRGFTTAEQYERLRALVRSLGLDPDTVFESGAEWDRPTSSEPDWHEVLGLEATVSLEEVQLAYRRLARQFHPDLWQNAGADDQARACQKMKELNGAYERAKKDLGTAGPQRGTATQQADDRTERERREHQAAAERDARAAAERQAHEVAEREARAKAERKARENAERQTREQAERRARTEPDRQAHDEAERKARRQAEERTREKAEREARQAAERVVNEAAERKAGEAFQSRSQEAAKPVADESNQAAAVPETPVVATVNLRAETLKARSESTSWNTGLLVFLLVLLVPAGVGAILYFSTDRNRRAEEIGRSDAAAVQTSLATRSGEVTRSSLIGLESEPLTRKKSVPHTIVDSSGLGREKPDPTWKAVQPDDSKETTRRLSSRQVLQGESSHSRDSDWLTRKTKAVVIPPRQHRSENWFYWRQAYLAGKYSAALDALEALDATERNDPMYHYLTAITHYRLGQMEQARHCLKSGAAIEGNRPIPDWGVFLTRVQGEARVWVENERMKERLEVRRRR